MISPSLTDLSLPGIIDDCRAEYERAERGGSHFDYWAIKWGRSLVEAVESPVIDEDKASYELNADLSRAEKNLKIAQAAINKALDLLDAIPSSVTRKVAQLYISDAIKILERGQ